MENKDKTVHMSFSSLESAIVKQEIFKQSFLDSCVRIPTRFFIDQRLYVGMIKDTYVSTITYRTTN